MATDSSRGTLPSSSRLTIDSSSSIARSNGNWLTSSLLVIFGTRLRGPLVVAKAGPDRLQQFSRPACAGTRAMSMRAHQLPTSQRADIVIRASASSVHQRDDMRRDRIAQRLQIIAAFEQ